MRKPPRVTSATALVTASLLAPVIASFLCWRAGASVADGVGTGAGVVDDVADGVVLGVGVGLGDADGVGVGVTDGLGADGLGLGDADGAGVGVTGVGVGLGVGVGGLVGSNPALPPDSFLTTFAPTVQVFS